MLKLNLIIIIFINWIKHNKKIFFILLINLSLVVAVIIYLFSFNNNMLHSKGPSIRKMTHGRMYVINGEINAKEVYSTINNFIDNTQLPEIEFIYFSGMADIGDKKGKITTVKLLKEELKGYYYDEKYDIQESGKAALAIDTRINLSYGTNFDENIKNININGKEYNVEYTIEQFIDGMEAMTGGVLARISYEDFYNNIRPITEVVIIFEKRLNDTQEKIFKNEIQKLNNLRELIIQPKETSNQRNYRIEMIIDIVLLMSASLCLIKIYEYIINKRKKEFIIYRMYGAKKTFTANVLFVEILILTVISFLIGMTIFLLVINITGINKYIHFNIITLVKTFFILICSMMIVVIWLIIKLNRYSLVELKKEAMQR